MFVSECSLSEVISQLQNKELTPQKFIDDLCNKLERWDPKIKAFLPESDRKMRLHDDLKLLYRKYPDPEKRPKLFGIPIGIKDLFRVDGFSTKAGSKFPENTLKGKEASCVSTLKNAGALILGKTITTEFAYFEPGPTRNPLNFDHTPGGSSSGSAAAVAAGFCPLALGTQTIGSIIRPASYCGIIGFKPSYGRIPVEGVVPFSPSADQVGFFVQDLASAVIASNILVKDWKNDDEYNLDDPVFGIPVGEYLDQASPEILLTFQKDVEKLKAQGFRIKQVEALNNISEINDLHQKMVAREFSQVHKKWHKKFGDLYSKTSSALIQQGLEIEADSVEQINAKQLLLRNEIEDLMKSEGIDLLISPATMTFAPKGLGSTGSPIMNLPWTFCGLPVLSIPGSKVANQLLSGLQIIAPFNQDEKLLYTQKIHNIPSK